MEPCYQTMVKKSNLAKYWQVLLLLFFFWDNIGLVKELKVSGFTQNKKDKKGFIC
jgi:hypothetical protein